MRILRAKSIGWVNSLAMFQRLPYRLLPTPLRVDVLQDMTYDKANALGIV
jgi:hypothetical protein